MTAKDEYTEIQSCMKEMGISFSAAEIATWAAAEGASDEDLRHIRSLLDAIAEKRRNERMSFLMKISRIPEAITPYQSPHTKGAFMISLGPKICSGCSGSKGTGTEYTFRANAFDR